MPGGEGLREGVLTCRAGRAGSWGLPDDGDPDHGQGNILLRDTAPQGGHDRPTSAGCRVPDSRAWSNGSWAGPVARRRSWGSAPGSSAPTGATCRRTTRSRCSRRRSSAGVTFFDTADVYGDGRSEQVIGRFLKEHPGITVATKMGRRVDQVPENYTLDSFRAWTDRSRANLGVDTLDLVQLHCPPSEVIDADATYDDLDTLVADGADRGVRRERRDRRPGALRDRPAERRVDPDHPQRVPAQAARRRCCRRRSTPVSGSSRGCRWPPACCRAGTTRARRSPPTTTGPSTGTARRSTSARRSRASTSRPVCRRRRSSRRWCRRARSTRPRRRSPSRGSSHQPGVTTVIPGARNAEQARANAAAGEIGPLPGELLDGVTRLYDTYFREAVHGRW